MGKNNEQHRLAELLRETDSREEEMSAIPDASLSEAPKVVLQVVSEIPLGRENAVTRKWLCEALQLSDRKVRECIEAARSYGCIIINAQDGAGYYRSDDPDDWERQYRQDTARAMSILVRRKHLRKRLKEAGREV